MYEFDDSEYSMKNDYEIQCINDDCGILGGTWDTKEEAIKVWNRRNLYGE